MAKSTAVRLIHLTFSAFALTFLLLGTSTGRSAVVLSLVNGTDIMNPNVVATNGTTFTASAYISGLTSQNPLDAFSAKLNLGVLPSGISVINYTPALSGWITYPGSGNDYSLIGSYASTSSFDLSENSILFTYTISLDSNLSQGVYDLDFTNDQFTQIWDTNGTNIPFTASSLTLTVIPESNTWILLLSGLVLTALAHAHPCQCSKCFSLRRTTSRK